MLRADNLQSIMLGNVLERVTTTFSLYQSLFNYAPLAVILSSTFSNLSNIFIDALSINWPHLMNYFASPSSTHFRNTFADRFHDSIKYLKMQTEKVISARRRWRERTFVREPNDYFDKCSLGKTIRMFTESRLNRYEIVFWISFKTSSP